ncbi:MAG: TrmH family RNA methyltransferase [Spirochaetota bacterium]
MIQVDIRSRNDRYQLVDSFRSNRHKRTKHRVVFAEGVAIVNAILASGTAIRSIVVPRERSLSDWATGVIETSNADELLRMDDELYAELSDRSNPTELIVLAERPANTLDALDLDALDLVTVLDRPSSPGNLGTCVRSCNAFGSQAVVVLGHAADVWDPQSLRASLGTVFTTPVIEVDSPALLLSWIDRWRAANEAVRVFGTDSTGSTLIGQEHVRCPAVVVFGNEATGLSATLRESVDEIVSIPMSGTVNSINLASALTVTLYAMRSKG